MKKYTIIAGVNGAGKTTLYQMDPDLRSINRVNADEILCENCGDWRNPLDVLLAGKEAVERKSSYIVEGVSFVQETTLCGRSILKTILRAKAEGYVIEVHYIGLSSVELAKERVANRVAHGGHGVKESDIERRYDRSFQNLKRILSMCNLVVLYDNSDKFRRFAIYKDGSLVRKSHIVPSWFERINDSFLGRIWGLEQFVNNTALVDENGTSVVYDAFVLEADKLAKTVKNRCLVFCLCKNSIGSVLGYVSFLNHGIVPVMLSSSLERELLDNLLDAYKPSFIWLPSEQKESFDGFEVTYEAYGHTLLKTGYSIQYLLHDDLALLLTTSGSTGSPKFVRQSYDNILANTKSIVEYLKLDETERPITTLPMNYTYGLSIINTHLYVGATILLTDKALMQNEFWKFFKEQKATSFGGVPYTYEMLDKLRFYRMDLPSLRTMTQAGGKLTPELHEKFAKYAAENGKNFVVMYGQCEATARMGYLPAEKAVEKKGSMGIAIPGGKFKLIDVNEQEITEPHVTGELVYEGANVTMGYAECGEDLIKGDERNGVLVTGDMAQFDEDGFYYITGRKKRFLKIYGNRVNLDEVDRLIKGKYEIEAACAGVDDHMYIFLTDGSMADSVKDYVASVTKLNPAAFKTVIIDCIPMNDSGKVQYRELEKYYG